MFSYLRKSIELANNYNYLDRLFSVYPVISNIRRNIDEEKLETLRKAYNKRDNNAVITAALGLPLFPVKDPYVAFLRRFPSLMKRNPQTVNRLSGMIYEMGWDKLLENITEPKEANRQLGNKFREWLDKKPLGLSPVRIDEFEMNKENAILDASDSANKDFAKRYFGYSRNKGLDFIARFNGKYVIGEAKFLTDFGGHQNAQFEDALSTLDTKVKGAYLIAILDGVLYARTSNKMYRSITNEHKDKRILSSLLLRDFLYQLS